MRDGDGLRQEDAPDDTAEHPEIGYSHGGSPHSKLTGRTTLISCTLLKDLGSALVHLITSMINL